MNFLAMIDTMSEEIYLSLKQAVELGKWANGVALTDEQKEQTMQAVIAWQAKHLDQKEHYTIGADGKLIERPKSELRRQFADDSNDIIRVNHNDL